MRLGTPATDDAQARFYSLFADRESYLEFAGGWRGSSRLSCERSLAIAYEECLIGHCACCDAVTGMRYALPADPDALPNWREELNCVRCGLINRVRFCLGYLRHTLRDLASPRIYATEQATLTYAWLKQRFPQTVGSEYLDESSNRKRLTAYLRDICDDPTAELRHEDVTQLSLSDASFDAVVSFDVLEHVPNFRAALAEFHRILTPGGRLVFTVPFMVTSQASLVRARIGSAGIEHLMEPEYHGDPTDETGCLAFYTFGWELLQDVRDAGFSDGGVLDGWCPAMGHLGGCMGTISATR